MGVAEAILVSAVIGAGASLYASSQQPDAPKAIEAPRLDKVVPQKKKDITGVEDADTESKKRKKQSAKDKFKVDLPEATTGVVTEKGTVQGVQI